MLSYILDEVEDSYKTLDKVKKDFDNIILIVQD